MFIDLKLKVTRYVFNGCTYFPCVPTTYATYFPWQNLFGKNEHWLLQCKEISIYLSTDKLNSDDWCFTCSLYSCISVKGAKHSKSSLIYSSTARVVWAPQIFHNQSRPFFPVLRCPLGLGELQAYPFPDVVFPPLLLSAVSSSPFHCTLQDGFCRT